MAAAHQLQKVTQGGIPWPIGKKREGSRARFIVVCGALVDAIRRESAQAVAYCWGITSQTVTHWRKALRVRATNEGKPRVRHDYAPGTCHHPGAGEGAGQGRRP